MGQILLGVVAALVVGAIVFAVAAMVTGSDPGLGEVEPDGRSVPLPTDRPLAEADMTATRFDTVARGYRMAQVDRALSRVAYDIGYKDELIHVLEAEVVALREGRTADADALHEARLAAQRPPARAAQGEDAAAVAGDDARETAGEPGATAGGAPTNVAPQGGGAPHGGSSGGTATRTGDPGTAQDDPGTAKGDPGAVSGAGTATGGAAAGGAAAEGSATDSSAVGGSSADATRP